MSVTTQLDATPHFVVLNAKSTVHPGRRKKLSQHPLGNALDRDDLSIHKHSFLFACVHAIAGAFDCGHFGAMQQVVVQGGLRNVQ